MPPKHLWTAPEDECLSRMRKEGGTWEAIAATLGVSRNTAISRCRRIGAPSTAPEPEEDGNEAATERGPEPLPPGHNLSWDAIT